MSRTPTRATKGTELIEKLTTIGDVEELDEWAIRGLRRDAQALMHVDTVAAQTVLAGIAALDGNASEVRKRYKIALQAPAGASDTLANYAVALSKAGEMNEAFETAVQAHERSPDDLRILELATALAVNSAEFHESLALYQHWNKLRPGEPRAAEPTMNKAANAVDTGAFSEEGAQQVVRLAHQVRLEANVRHAGGTLWAVYGVHDSFQIEVGVHTSMKRAAELTEQLADRIVADEELMTDPGGKFMLMFAGTTPHGSDARATS